MRKLSFTDADLRVAAQEAWEAMAVSLSDINHNELEIPSGFRDRIMQMAKQYWEKEESEKRQRRKRALLRAAAIFIAILLGASAFFAVNTEARAAVQEWFKEVYERFILYRFNGIPVEGKVPEYEPNWLPNGYEKKDQIQEEHGQVFLYAKDKSGDVIVFRYYQYSDDPLSVAPGMSGDFYYEKVQVNSIPADYYYEIDPSSSVLIWINEEERIVFMISSVLSKNDNLSIAKSVDSK